MSDVFTVTFHPPDDGWLAQARHHDRRVALTELALDAVTGGDDPVLVALPAGFLRASSIEARDNVAEAMRALSRRTRAALLFGVDVCGDEGWAPIASAAESYAFACDGGRPMLWPARQVRGSARGRPPPPDEPRCLELAGRRVGVVISGEAFNAPLRMMLARAHPELVVVLAHAPPTERWDGALGGLGAIAPTLVVEQRPPLSRRRGDRPPPPGWSEQRVAQTRDMTIRRYSGPLPMSARA